jgi:hypothetical protein
MIQDHSLDLDLTLARRPWLIISDHQDICSPQADTSLPSHLWLQFHQKNQRRTTDRQLAMLAHARAAMATTCDDSGGSPRHLGYHVQTELMEEKCRGLIKAAIGCNQS